MYVFTWVTAHPLLACDNALRLGRNVLTGSTVCGDPVSWFQTAGYLTGPAVLVVGREDFGKSSLIRRMTTAH